MPSVNGVHVLTRNLKWQIALYLGAAATLLPLIAGCGGSYNASVKGMVTLDSSALTRGTVTFTPSQTGPSGYGVINEDGSYSIKVGLEDGIPSGDYTVTVAGNEKSTPNVDPALAPKPGKPITPAWYRDATKSPLKYTVEHGKNEINLELTSQPPAGSKPAGRK